MDIDNYIKLAENIRSHLVLLYHSKTGETGSGVLIKILDRLFVISAAHVIKSTNVINIGLSFQQSTFTILDSYIDDELDIGYIEIKPFEYEILKVDQSKPLNISKKITTTYQYPNKSFILCGYPCTLKEKENNAFKITPLLLDCAVLNPDNWSSFLREKGITPEHHIIVAYGSKHGDKFYDMKGNPLPFFDPKGMSGCGIWMYAGSKQNVNAGEYGLVGIQHSYIKSDQVLVCTFADNIIDVVSRRLKLQFDENNGTI